MANIRIVCLDYYMSAPTPGLDTLNSEFRGSNIIKLPILRLFGSSDNGLKTCLHIHGVFPYIYIPYDGSDEPNGVAYKIASALDKSLNISMGQTSSNQQHVYKVALISAIPFYGYHAQEHQFFKISFYNPMVIRRACALLQNGAILGKIYQPHESHIPFQQQFMIDYNLHGMNFIRISNVRTKAEPVSCCEQELDVLQQEILNQHEVNEVNPGIKYICDDEIERRRMKGLDVNLKPCLSLDRTDIRPTLSHWKWKHILEERLKKKSVDRREVSSLEESVYAAETPLSQTTLSGTSIDLDVSQYEESVLENTFSLDADAELLMGMLEIKEQFEEDSILTQIPNMEEEEDVENEMDLTMPLNTTPVKINSSMECEALDDSLFNNTLVQLDGTFDDEIVDTKKKTTRRTTKSKSLVQASGSNVNLKHFSNCYIKLVDLKYKYNQDYLRSKNPIMAKRLKYKNVKKKENFFKVYNDSNKDLGKIKKKKNIVLNTNKLSKLKLAKIKSLNLLKKELQKQEMMEYLQKIISCGKKPKFRCISKQEKEMKLSLKNQYPNTDWSSELNTVKEVLEIIPNINNEQSVIEITCTHEKPILNTEYLVLNNFDENSNITDIIKTNDTNLESNLKIDNALMRNPSINFNYIFEPQNKAFYEDITEELVHIYNEFEKSVSKTNQYDNSVPTTVWTKEEKRFCNEYHKVVEQRFDDIMNNQTKLMKSFMESMKDVLKNGRVSTKLMLDRMKEKRKSCSGENIVQVDGHNDSSEDEKTIKRRKTRRKTQFSALNIVVTNSPKKISEEISNTQNISDVTKKTKLNAKEKSKRRLTFDLLDETQMTEKLACSYKQSNKKFELKDFQIKTDVSSEKTLQDNVNMYDSENMFIPIASSSKMTDITVATITSLDNSPSKKANVPNDLQNISQHFEFESNVSQPETNINISNNIRSSMFQGDQRDKFHLIVNDNESDSSDITPQNVDKSPEECITSPQINIIGEENSSKIKFETSGSSLVKLDDADLTLSEHSQTHLSKKVFELQDIMAPTNEMIESTMALYKLPQVHNQDPFYGNPSDVTGSVEVGRNVLKITTIGDVEEFQTSFSGISEYQKAFIKKSKNSNELINTKLSHCPNEDCILVPIKKPPTSEETIKWLETKKKSSLDNGPKTADVSINVSCQISGATLDNTHGFKLDLENLQNARSVNEYQYITTLVVELHIQTREDLKPDPQYDSVRAIFYSILNDVPEDNPKPRSATGLIAVNSQNLSPIKSNKKLDILYGSSVNSDITYVQSEEELYKKLLELVQFWDPDILIGYEIETLSWGYLIERGYNLGVNYLVQLSRIPDASQSRAKDDRDEGHSEIRITGRIVLDLWRLLKHEIALQSYTFENCVYHILHERVPYYSSKLLTNWWRHRCAKIRSRTANYYLYRVKTTLKLLNQLDLIGRTSELARLFGIQFYEVLSRGSQFRVESMMLRLAKPSNFVPVSPNVQQRANMRAPEYIPLVLEPESKFYKDPVIVLDFQSLYPSMIIAYNYCFSTCLGKVEYLGSNSPFEFGATQLKVSRGRVERLASKDLLNYSPCGAVFVKKDVRLGILPKMLQEILNTRLLVKKAMKDEKDNNIMQRVLHSRQLGLKLIANVTYGYTAANFSGRMPSVEVGDSVVSKGRETLQRAIATVESNEKWGARVVYGDTDSLFVLVPGKSREEAFKIGAEIAEIVTLDNPSPVKLKLEKVYQPCILQTKKRYVGNLYESPDQKEPQFDAKGIETIRRDGCPAVSKMLEKCLKLLFDTRDVSLIKKYVLRQFEKLISNRISIQELTFAKEFRGVSGYKPGACVPALELARKWKELDRRNEPRNGERVPYVIVNGPPGLPLIKMVRSPRDLLSDSSLRPNALYYITKAIIPAINRCFLLIGADLNQWFNEMPRKQIQYLPTSSPTKGPKTTISQYFATTNCVCCSKQSKEGLCERCSDDPQSMAVILFEKIKNWERNYNETFKICKSCCSMQTNNKVQSDTNDILDLDCSSLDCPVLYRVIQTRRDLQQAAYVRGIIEKLPEFEF